MLFSRMSDIHFNNFNLTTHYLSLQNKSDDLQEKTNYLGKLITENLIRRERNKNYSTAIISLGS